MFNYHQPNVENLKEYLSKESEKGEGTNWWSIPAGMSSIRILPPWDPSGRVALPVYMHPIEFKGKDMSFTKYNWTCVNKTFGKPCPICDGLAKLSESGVDISNWEANRRQFYFNAIIMHDPTYDNKGKGAAPGSHVLMKAPKTFYDWVIAQITNPMIGDITSIDNGIDVYITKEGTGLGTTYSMTLSPNGRTPIPPEYLEKIKDLYNLDDIFSTGFEKDQIDELVSHLGRSAGVMVNAVSNMSNQMAGYTQAPPTNNMGFQPPNTGVVSPTTPIASPVTMPAASPYAQQVPVQPTPSFNTQAPPTPQPSEVPPTQSGTGAQNSNLPKCYGQYDPGNVNCVVCNFELDCSQRK